MASMLKGNRLPALSYSALALSLALGTTTALADDQPSSVAVAAPAAENAKAPEKITITGSSIKRIDAETALPVQVITAEDIKKTGYTSVTDLIQNLPVMQGFTTSSQSVNGGGGGATTASIHGIGSAYTLVLLNGRRLAPYTDGSDVNLNELPLAAIERVEVLTDGASALYGSDAIAGVVNFITKKDTTEGTISASGYAPQHDGGGSYNFAASKGFGDLDKDKFNILVAASYDKQELLNASDRSFAKTAQLSFFDQGQLHTLNSLLSSNAFPSNVQANLSNGQSILLNRYYVDHGHCPAGEVAVTYSAAGSAQGTYCKFDPAPTEELIPASDRSSFYTSGRLNLTDKVSAFTEFVWSKFYNDPRFAPNATGKYPLTAGQIAKDINPVLAQLGYAGASVTDAVSQTRLVDGGGRQDRYETDTRHIVLGLDFSVSNVDLTASLIHSFNKQTDTEEGGYLDALAFQSLLDSGAYDPVTALPGTSVSLIGPTVIHQVVNSVYAGLDVLNLNGSTSIGKLDGGDIGLGFGVNYTKQEYKDDPSAILQGANSLQPNYQDSIYGVGGGALPVDSIRNSYGVFSEFDLPFTKDLEANASVRYDSYGKVKNKDGFDPLGNFIGSEDQGTTASSSTYKLSLKYRPVSSLLLRGSVGSGFKAPTLTEISSTFAYAGVTGSHPCPFQPGDSRYVWCGSTSQPQQFNLFTGGNPSTGANALKPEHSTQWTFGARYEPSALISVGADFWAVNFRDQISTVSEAAAFGDGTTTTAYPGLFSYKPTPGSGVYNLTLSLFPTNVAKSAYKGIDLDLASLANTSIGKLTSTVKATFIIQDDYQQPGIPGYSNDLGKVGQDGTTDFRWLLDTSFSLQTGKFTNTLTTSVKPGYKDDWSAYTSNGILSPDSPNRRVGAYALFNWQTRYDITGNMSVTGGVQNLFDRQPPFSINHQLATGNQFGYDGRYSDPIGRQLYLAGSYKF